MGGCSSVSHPCAIDSWLDSVTKSAVASQALHLGRGSQRPTLMWMHADVHITACRCRLVSSQCYVCLQLDEGMGRVWQCRRRALQREAWEVCELPP